MSWPTRVAGCTRTTFVHHTSITLIATTTQHEANDNEGTLYLAIEATKATVPDSTKHASKAFEVPETTLRRRRDGKLPRGDCVPNSKKLKEMEEAIVARILELYARGIGATRTMVQGMANDLLAAVWHVCCDHCSLEARSSTSFCEPLKLQDQKIVI